MLLITPRFPGWRCMSTVVSIYDHCGTEEENVVACAPGLKVVPGSDSYSCYILLAQINHMATSSLEQDREMQSYQITKKRIGIFVKNPNGY